MIQIPTLMEFQRTTVNYGIKNPYSIYALQQGLGKSFCALSTAVETGSKTLIICPAYLRMKWKSEIKKFFPDKVVSLFENDKQFYSLWDTDFAIISYNYVGKSDILFEWADMVVYDECFHENTLVNTSRGEIKISQVVVGDYVENCLGFSKVKSVTPKTVSKALSINFNGREIVCSYGHPFLTSRGWVEASELVKGDLLVSTNKSVRVVQNPNGGKESSFLREELFSEMENVSTRDVGEGSFERNPSEDRGQIERLEKAGRIFKNVGEKPDAFGGFARENEKYFKENRSQAVSEGWKRAPANIARENSNGFNARTVLELCYIFGEKVARISSGLQSRFGSTGAKDSYRGRREQPRATLKETSRQEERGETEFFRVEGIEVLESSDPRLSGENNFYDLGVEGHPSFSVNGALVHNCHYLKTMTAKRTEESHRLIFENSIKRCLLLTGTPITNRVYEFYSLIAICNYNPKIKKSEFLDRFSTYVDFANYFSYLKEYEVLTNRGRRMVQQWEGYRNEAELKSYLKDCYIRFTSDEVLDLPPFQTIDVPISYDDRPELMSVFEQFTSKGELTGVASDIKSQAALAKAPFTVTYVENLLDQDEQVVVYTDHVLSCEFMAEKLGVIAITGKTDMGLRQEIANKFMEGKIRVVVATIGSFSTGIDLYASANMVFNDLTFVPGTLEQAMYRIRRIGQTRRCNFHFIFGSIQDEKIRNILNEKIETINKVV